MGEVPVKGFSHTAEVFLAFLYIFSQISDHLVCCSAEVGMLWWMRRQVQELIAQLVPVNFGFVFMLSLKMLVLSTYALLHNQIVEKDTLEEGNAFLIARHCLLKGCS